MIGKISVRTLSYTTENPEKVFTAIFNILGNLTLTKKTARGHFGNEVIIITGEITGKKRTKETWNRIIESLDKEDRVKLREEIIKRLDEENNFHLRFDKQIALTEGKPKLISHGDAIHVKVKILSFSGGRDSVIKKLEEMIDAN